MFNTNNCYVAVNVPFVDGKDSNNLRTVSATQLTECSAEQLSPMDCRICSSNLTVNVSRLFCVSQILLHLNHLHIYCDEHVQTFDAVVFFCYHIGLCKLA